MEESDGMGQMGDGRDCCQRGSRDSTLAAMHTGSARATCFSLDRQPTTHALWAACLFDVPPDEPLPPVRGDVFGGTTRDHCSAPPLMPVAHCSPGEAHTGSSSMSYVLPLTSVPWNELESKVLEMEKVPYAIGQAASHRGWLDDRERPPNETPVPQLIHRALFVVVAQTVTQHCGRLPTDAVVNMHVGRMRLAPA